MPASPPLYPASFRTHHKRQAQRAMRRPVEVPEHAGPHVKLFFTEMRRQMVRYQDVEDATAVRRATLKAWRRKNSPSLVNLQAAFSLLGYDYVPVPALEILPAELAGDLTALAEPPPN